MNSSKSLLVACLVLIMSGVAIAQPGNDVPPDIRKKLDYFNGVWNGVWTYADGRTEREHFVRRPILQGRYALLTGTVGDTKFHLVSGWDSSDKMVTDYIFASDGSWLIEKWTVKDDGKWFTLESRSFGIDADGKKVIGENVARVTGPNEYIYESKKITVDGKKAPGFRAVITRSQSTATRDQFLELGEKLVGEWVSEFEVDIDVDGICEAGDPIAEFRSYEWVSSKTAILGTRVYKINGKTVAEGTALISWDGPKKQIRSSYFDSLGGNWQSVWKKRGKRYVIQDRGVFGDGRSSIGRTTIIPSNDGKTLSFELTNRSFDNQPLANKTITHQRLQK